MSARTAGTPRDLLNPEVLASLSNLELVARAAVHGFLNGLHRSPFFGFSQEFAEYRAYSEGDDPRVRRYLALAVGRLDNPPVDAVDALVDGLDDPNPETTISVIWALAALEDPSVRDEIQGVYDSDDPGVRKMAVRLRLVSSKIW